MEGHQGILLVLIFASFSIRHLVQAQQDQQGFVSLICGLPTKESPYIEPNSKLKFLSDEEFIQSGKSGRVAQDWSQEEKYYNFLRYFPGDGLRNCYNLKVNQGTDYLIRAGFSYGNYDGHNIHPKFDMYIGPNLWTTVEIVDSFDYEIIHKTKSNNLQICLVKTGETIPIISRLELRPLKDGIYFTQSGSLKLLDRLFYPSDTGYIEFLRYVNSTKV